MRLILCTIAFGLLCVSVSAAPAAVAFRLDAEGAVIDHGADGAFVLTYPVLVAGDDTRSRILDSDITPTRATVRYEGGGELLAELDGATLRCSFRDVPAGTQKLHVSMLIDNSYKDGGTWHIGAETNKSFPKEKPPTPMLYQGNATDFSFVSQYGVRTGVTIPASSYQQLQDNREWGWAVYAWQCWIPYNPDTQVYTIELRGAVDAEKSAGFRIDRFGQAVGAHIIDRVHSEDELEADVETEKAYYASFDPPELDAYGGLPGSGERLGLTRTGFFHVQKVGDRWILVDPAGNAFFHLGICSFGPVSWTYIEGRESIYEQIPPRDGNYAHVWHWESYWNPRAVSFHLANQARKYGEPTDVATFQARMIDRVRRMGFNSSGAFSPVDRDTMAAKNFPFTSGLPGAADWAAIKPLPGIRGAFDVFDEANWVEYDRQAQGLAANADDPLLIGYFLDNEPTHEAVSRVVASLKSTPAKRRLVQFLEDTYADIAAFSAAWDMQVDGFPALVDTPLPILTEAAFADLQEFDALFFETYYRRLSETVRTYDPNHMLIGNRWQATSTANNAQLCAIAGKYMDVVSVNYYTYRLDTDFLARLHEWTGGRPIILSEFYWSSSSDSGVGAFKDVDNQQQRGLAYRDYVERAAALGFIVGVEWFTLVDAPATGVFYGRYDGERPNCGLFAVNDRPWKAMIGEMVKTNHDIYAVHLGEREPFRFDDPRFTGQEGGVKKVTIARTAQPMTIDGARTDWPVLPPETITARRLVEGADAGESAAVFRLCYDQEFLYIHAEVTDATPMMNSRNGAGLWQADGLEVFVGHEDLDAGGKLMFGDRQLLLGAGPDGDQFYVVNAPAQFACQMAVARRVDGEGYTIEATIPFADLGFAPEPGREIVFDMAVDNSTNGASRKSQIMWNGIARNSTDRSAWGRAVFGE